MNMQEVYESMLIDSRDSTIKAAKRLWHGTMNNMSDKNTKALCRVMHRNMGRTMKYLVLCHFPKDMQDIFVVNFTEDIADICPKEVWNKI